MVISDFLLVSGLKFWLTLTWTIITKTQLESVIKWVLQPSFAPRPNNLHWVSVIKVTVMRHWTHYTNYQLRVHLNVSSDLSYVHLKSCCDKRLIGTTNQKPLNHYLDLDSLGKYYYSSSLTSLDSSTCFLRASSFNLSWSWITFVSFSFITFIFGFEFLMFFSSVKKVFLLFSDEDPHSSWTLLLILSRTLLSSEVTALTFVSGSGSHFLFCNFCRSARRDTFASFAFLSGFRMGNFGNDSGTGELSLECRFCLLRICDFNASPLGLCLVASVPL